MSIPIRKIAIDILKLLKSKEGNLIYGWGRKILSDRNHDRL